MSAEPFDGGAAFPRDTKWNPDGSVCQRGSAGQSYRADVAKECLAALMVGGDILERLTYDDAADIAVRAADALIERLKGGAK